MQELVDVFHAIVFNDVPRPLKVSPSPSGESIRGEYENAESILSTVSVTCSKLGIYYFCVIFLILSTRKLFPDSLEFKGYDTYFLVCWQLTDRIFLIYWGDDRSPFLGHALFRKGMNIIYISIGTDSFENFETRDHDFNINNLAIASLYQVATVLHWSTSVMISLKYQNMS